MKQPIPSALPAKRDALAVATRADLHTPPDAILDAALNTADAAALAHAAAAQGLRLATADCDRARSHSAVLRAVARALDAAEYFGGDYEGLFDCLCDAVAEQKNGVILWLHNLHSGDPALADDATRIDVLCQDVTEYARRHGKTFHYRITHAGRHPEPEPGSVTSWSAAGK